MNQKLLSKVLATMLAVTLTFANFVMLGIYATETYATMDALENQETALKNTDVSFDAYFTNEKGEKTHTAKVDIDENEKLYLAVNVESGYLKNAKITMLASDASKVNFAIINNNEKPETVENINYDNNTISLKQINSGTGVVLEVPISSVKQDMFDLSDFNKINNITLTGLYVGNSGKEVKVEKTINVRNEWVKNTNISVEQQTKTFIPYEVKDAKGTILQTVIKTGIENNSLPIKETKIAVEVPEINGLKPEQVIVTANTNATNNNKKLTSNDYTYDAKTGILNITVKNEPVENKVTWNKLDKDEYFITYIYNEKIDEVKVASKVKVDITAYNVTNALSKENILNIEEKSIKGNFVTTQINTNDKLSKGYLYTKANKELEYNENVQFEIVYADLTDKIVVENQIDNFVNSKEQLGPTTVANKNFAYYKTTTIAKANFEEILGQDGYIKIIGQDGEILAIFNKDTVSDKNGNYTYKYEKEINNLKIETSKPVQSGILEINHVKALKGNTDYSKNQIVDFAKLRVGVTSNVEYSGTVIETVDTYKDITLIAPSTKIEASVNKLNLSTVEKNEDVKIKVTLKTNDISCDLYKNPKVEIVLPSYIKEVNVKDVNVLFDNELKIKNSKVYVNEFGNTVISVELSGAQTTYSQNEISKGANIIVNTDITLEKLTPTKDDVIKVYITNENVTTYENTENTKLRSVSNKGYTETVIKAVAPTGMVTTTTITGYNKANETVTSISGKEVVGKLDAKSEKKTANVKMDVINNYSNKINNIKILGRIPEKENKSVVTNDDLGSNLNTVLASKINLTDVTNYTIYYSANKTATEDLANVTNGWSEEISDVNTISSYLIVFNEYEMNTGDSISFDYNINIPKDVSYNMSVYTNYVVYFDNIKANETIKDKQISAKIGLTTGEGPNLEVAIRSDRAGEIEEGEIITYTIAVKNAGSYDVKDVTVKGNIPEGTTYTYTTGEAGGEDIVERHYDSKLKEYSKTIETIKANETKTITYQVEANSLNAENTKEIETTGTVNVKNYDAVFTSQTIKKVIIKGYLKTELEMQPSYENKKEGQEFNYILTITNVNNDVKNNVEVTNKLPDGISFVSATKEGKYDENTNTVKWTIDKIAGKGTEFLILKVKINELSTAESLKYIKNSMTVKTSEKELKSNEVTFNVSKPILVITGSSSTPENIIAGDKIEYNFTIKNIGETQANNLVLTDYMPDGVLYRGSTYIVDGKTYSSWIGSEKAIISIPTLKPKETVDITINALVKDTDENKTERKIVNIAQLTAESFKTIGSNLILHNIVVKAQTQDPSVQEPVKGTYKISGRVWFDENGDGRRDENETNMRDISVALVDSETGKVVTDIKTGVKKVQSTNENGMYTFANLNPGKYLVVFYYDAKNYTVTKYRADGVIDSKNSDVIAMEATQNGETVIAGVANSIQITSSDVTNIDMGLIKNPKFDLKLDKTVSKITVNNSNGTKTYEYNNEKLAKVDIKDKDLSSSTVIIEYKIKVTNEGEVAGYAKKIVDYIPSGMKFNSELNPEWYIADSGNAFNASLANTLIKPGETKEVTLVLTRKMTDENTGTVNNIAEIYEASNDLGLQDIDSIVANKVQIEDDYSSADVIIGVRTGEVYIYIMITLTSIIILGVGIYLINKKVLGKI